MTSKSLLLRLVILQLCASGLLRLPGCFGQEEESAMTLSLLTLNTNDGVVSVSAPSGWSQRSALAQLLTKLQPQVVTLQESDFKQGAEPEIDALYDWVPASAVSHRGSCVTLLLKSAKLNVAQAPIVVGPAMAVMLRSDSGNRFWVVNAHLQPFSGKGTERAAQVANVLMHMHKREERMRTKAPVIFAGDMNMRENETEAMCHRNGLKDAWIEAGSSSRDKFTWNRFVNRYYEVPRLVKCRFDRIFLKRGTLLEPRCTSFQMVADTPFTQGPGNPGPDGSTEERQWYLSDHFGILASIEIGPAEGGYEAWALARAKTTQKLPSSSGPALEEGECT